MILRIDPKQRERIGSAVGVALLHALLGYALLTGLGFEVLSPPAVELTLFEVDEEPPPPPAEPARPDTAESEKAKPKDAEGAASPANLKDTPTQIVAPPPEIRLPVLPPIPAAPVAGQGNADSAGAAQIPGPGTGAGGIGSGLGSGAQGTGTGGGGGGRGTPARLIRGSIRDSDYPAAAYRGRVTGTVYLRFVVAPSGRVTDCAVTRSSGSRELDSTTCRLIIARFRYRPARDAQGRAIASTIRGEQAWELGPEPPPIEVEGEIEE